MGLLPRIAMQMNEYIKLSARVAKLEKAVFDHQRTSTKDRTMKSGLRKGPTDGIITLIQKGFFDPPNRRTSGEVRKRLAQIGKDYSGQAVCMALMRLSKPTGPLSRPKAGVYVARK